MTRLTRSVQLSDVGDVHRQLVLRLVLDAIGGPFRYSQLMAIDAAGTDTQTLGRPKEFFIDATLTAGIR
jgi:hypothetical protein